MLGDMPAYPCKEPRQDLGPEVVLTYLGMTIRQRYAMAAMQGFSANPVAKDWDFYTLAESAYRQADAMIEFEEKEYEEKRKAAETKEAEEKS